ncbi:MAG: amino acid adenylation domain-containing protein, partial [Gemmatimonadetes bacterium]|nr:amino acid adenylation domain-containing protein [Gemmatimonadota bacterium]
GARLPEYMVPSDFVLLDELPLNPNGKVDRRRLPAPEEGAAEGYAPPRTRTEAALAEIFAGILRRGRVGVHGDFFALGGHSLLATRVISRVREELGVELPLRALFEAPTVAGLAGRVDTELALTAGTRRAPEIRPVPRDGSPLPLSFAQQRLWFVEQLEPGNVAYSMPFPLRLRGALDVRALERTLTELVRRHESLRTTFAVADGEPAQVVAPPRPVALATVDLSALPAEERERAVLRLAAEEAMRPFDLARGPLLRTGLVRLADDDQVLLFTLHHVVSDGWSMGVLTREVGALYAAFARGESSPLPEPPIQYADFAAWEREWLSGDNLAALVGYWAERLRGAPALLELPTDRPRPARRSYRGAQRQRMLPRELLSALHALARREGATLYMVVLAAFKLLLSRLAGQPDVVVGTPIAGRTRRETEGVIGLFVNTLALRTDLSGMERQGFRELLARVREGTLGAYAHQDVPFEKLLEELQVERSLAHTPLFQVMFNFLNLDEERRELPSVSMQPLAASGDPDSKFDFTLYAQEQEGGLFLRVLYTVELFDAERMEGMLAQLHALLEQVAADPDLPLAAYSLGGHPALPDPTLPLDATWDGPVHARFAARAALSPERIALRHPAGDEWTYAELDARANRLAHRLREQGAGREQVVAVYADRGTALVWAMLGVLKAGAAFLVLDPAYPATRLARQLRAAGPRILLQAESAGPLPAEIEAWLAEADAPRLVLPAARTGFLDEHPAEAPAVEVGPNDLAYVVFTSGTTGEPKGILGTHAPLAHFVGWQRDRFGLAESDRFSLLSGLAHDPLLRDVFTPLSLGATLCIPDARELGTPGYLAGWMAREGVTVAHLTPAMASLLASGDAALPALRHAFWGGDKVRAGDVAALRARAPGVESTVFYGATETPQAVAFFPVPRETADTREVLPVGHGIDGVQLLVLTPAGGLAGVGEVGEICVRTPYLARGYLHDEAGTRERFVVSPFTGNPADRVYRTGDLGRYRPDGEVQILGRADGQVKVRGFRVEPAEIEAALRAHPQVRDAAVVPREDTPGEPRLVGYVVADGEAPDGESLRAWLRERLPEYMVPAAWVVLDALPLTPNGKLDRRALPAPEPAAEAAYVAPRTPTEEVLAGIWGEVLRVERVGVTDDFFALGGHSLLATRLASRVREAFGVELPLRALFEAPTVAALAARVDGTARAESAPPIRRVPRDGSPLPLSFGQQRLWFIHRMDPTSSAYHLSYPLRLRGALDVPALERALTALVERHESLRTVFPEREGEPVQVILPPAPQRIEVADLRGVADGEREERVRVLVADQALRPFDLAEGPLLRTLLARVADDEWVLCFTLHHVVSDGWSLGVLVREVNELYRAHSRGEAARLPELPVQYADYAVWQRRWLEGGALAEQTEYWRKRLAGVPTRLELPTDFPPRPAESAPAATLPFRLAPEAGRALRELCRREGATPFMGLLAAFSLLLSRWSGQDDVSVGSPIAGRTRREVEGLIGFFVNTLVLRTDLSSDPTFRALLRQVRETTLGAYAHQDLPFEHLVEELQPERSLTHTPLFQVLFVLQNVERGALRLGDLAVEPVPMHEEEARFDLSVTLFEDDERFHGGFTYRADLFEAATVERMAGHFARLLEEVAAHPDCPVEDVDLLTPAERVRVLDADRPGTEYPRTGIHALVAAQAARTPAAVAVASGARTLTYAELERRANQLANHLRGMGIGTESRVGVCMERSPELVVGILGILKAGAAYVPLDPAYPAERLAYMLEDAGIGVLLTQEHVVPRLPATGAALVRLDADAERIARESGEAPAVTVDPEQLAYVIYTSGSTGRPKGVAMTQRPLLNLLAWQLRSWNGPAAARTLQFASASFDVSFQEIFATWASGGTLVLVSEEVRTDMTRLALLLDEERIERIFLPFVALQHLAEAAGERSGASLREVITAGEQLRVTDPVRRWLGGIEGCALVNQYGPSETHVATALTLAGPAGRWPQLPGIGHPIDNARAYVLDRALRPAPVGVPGELYLGGDAPARGYLGRPELTAEKWVPDPFSAEPGARLYRTGDRARRLASGELEFLGRVDQQVKIRGFRVEPGEVESALEGHPAVREAAVLVRDDSAGQKRLVAYVVPAAGAGAAETAEVRRWLGERLPKYMIPSAVVVLDALPLTPSGKLDRRALPEAGLLDAPEYVAPHTPVEEILAGIWAEVLQLPRVGVHDDFFALGGHSLLATRVASRVREAFGVEVPVRAFFETPTVAGLAERIAAEQPEAQVEEWEMAEELDRIAGLSEEEVLRLLGE